VARKHHIAARERPGPSSRDLGRGFKRRGDRSRIRHAHHPPLRRPRPVRRREIPVVSMDPSYSCRSRGATRIEYRAPSRSRTAVLGGARSGRLRVPTTMSPARRARARSRMPCVGSTACAMIGSRTPPQSRVARSSRTRFHSSSERSVRRATTLCSTSTVAPARRRARLRAKDRTVRIFPIGGGEKGPERCVTFGHEDCALRSLREGRDP
jgi:hypothetical protein